MDSYYLGGKKVMTRTERREAEIRAEAIGNILCDERVSYVRSIVRDYYAGRLSHTDLWIALDEHIDREIMSIEDERRRDGRDYGDTEAEAS
jgi:hypothetical protein